MKRNLFLIGIVFSMLLYSNVIIAQAPKTSTAEDPIWYYIQVIGTSTVSNRVFTCEEDGTVHGRERYVTMDREVVDTQLWRFEARSSTNRRIINKATGKMLHVVYDEAKQKRFAVVADASTLSYSFPTNGDYNNIKIATNESTIGGTTGHVYAWQSLPAAQFDYAIEFRPSTSMDSDNARFKFIFSGDYLPEISDEKNYYWYHITTAKTGHAGKAVTYVNNSPNSRMKFSLEDLKTPFDDNQLWRVELNNTSDGEVVQFINKATGYAIGTDVDFYDFYYVQPSTEVKGNGWFIASSSEGAQCCIRTKNDDGSISYLNATVAGENTEIFSDSYTANTGYAWIFSFAQNEDAAIPQVDNKVDFVPYVENRRIYIQGIDDYTVRNVYGVTVNKDNELKSGVYLVTVKGETQKVLVP
ncbi:hypothetical protein LJB98_00815 [Bacteroidales bacterium OttesenSCG-928-M11]|nr:hypothetical protein [Bacteroidales bacterium OttesenSCG-928-M11]